MSSYSCHTYIMHGININTIDASTVKLHAWQTWGDMPSVKRASIEANADDVLRWMEGMKIPLWFEETDIIPGVDNETSRVSTMYFGNPTCSPIVIQFNRTIMLDYDEENPEESTNELVDFCTDFEVFYREGEGNDVCEEFIGFVLNNQLENIDIGRFFMVSAGPAGFYLTPTKVSDMEVDIELHYGDSFIGKHENILKSIVEGNKGIYLFHGEPGTGKTTYLRYLISQVSKHKNIIYLPSYMMWNISNPEFITFLQANKGAVLVLEDAEAVLQKRDGQYNDQAVSNILNISDGLLNDATGMQIIATFNANKTQLDPAIMRAGRMINEHEFVALDADTATKLSKHIGKNVSYDKHVTLAEVYNGEPDKKHKKKKRVGLNNHIS